MSSFVHLHNHTEFSLLDGACRVKDLVNYAVEQEMPAIAITDHGMMYGAMEFYLACKDKGIKPLVGVELYLATRGMTQRDPKKDGSHHLVAIAKNEIGYKNLLQLTTRASLEGFYYKPRVDKELLAKHSEGLIICSACLGAEVPQMLMKEGYEQGRNAAAWYREVFGDDFYIELQDHGIPEQATVNVDLKRIAESLGIKMVATNDVHYVKADDANAHDVLVCIQTGTNVNDPKRMKYEPRNFYLKTADEMRNVFENFCPEAIANTLEIADKCDLKIEMGHVPLPAVDLPPGKSSMDYMADLCREGLERRYIKPSNEHRDRLEYELKIVEQTGYSQYFLIVMDISNYSRAEGIFFGVRGSAAGSIASYCLGITDIDPVEYNLTFERFLNPERVSMPDIDMDFEDTRRGEVFNHVVRKYGDDHVAQLVTFGTLGAKAVLRDVGRALEMPELPPARVDAVAKMIPSMPPGISIDRALAEQIEFRTAYESDPAVKKLVDTAKRLEGISRHTSVHAAGVMIADKPLVNYTPLWRNNDGALTTQYPHNSLEKLGVLKMDFLGLVNLTILSRAVKLIKRTRNEEIDVWKIPLENDPRADKAYAMLGRGETTGIFQLESAGMRKYIVDLKPNSVKELAAMVALYRPGPLQHIPRFINAKFDASRITYLHPLLEPILRETYGVIVYQDQVLKIVQAIAGFTLGQADLLRRAMGKKKREEMEKQRENFLKGAAERNVSKKIAEEIFAEIEPFAGYAFNGAHAACYAMVAYQTAYLKANYPAEYLAALMGSYIDHTDKIVATLEECVRLKVKVLPPCINSSFADFTVEGADAIRFGLQAIKNVGKVPIEAILAAREKGGNFASLEDFCNRVYAEGLTSKSVIEMLIKAGSFSTLHPNRRALIEALDVCVSAAQRGVRDAAAGLISLFGDDTETEASVPQTSAVVANMPDFGRGELLTMEKELLGFYLGDHPIKPFEMELRRKYNAVRYDSLKETQPGQEVTVGGLVAAVKTRYTKKNEPMLSVTLEDTSGSLDVTCFPKATTEFSGLLIPNAVVVVKGKVSHRERFGKANAAATTDGDESNAVQVEIHVDKVLQIALSAMTDTIARARSVHVRIEPATRPLLRMLRDTVTRHPGGSPLFLHIETAQGEQRVRAEMLIDPADELLEQVRRLLGSGARRTCWVE